MFSKENKNIDNRPVDDNIETDPDKEMIYEIAEPEEFVRVRDSLMPDLLAYLTPHTAEEYRRMRVKLYLSKDKKSGFGLKTDKQLISVFSLYKRRGRKIVKLTVGLGAASVECLGEMLRRLYGREGFQVIEKLPWNDAIAPKNWNYDRFGRPNYYILKREGSG